MVYDKGTRSLSSSIRPKLGDLHLSLHQKVGKKPGEITGNFAPAGTRNVHSWFTGHNISQDKKTNGSVKNAWNIQYMGRHITPSRCGHNIEVSEMLGDK
jgi:hypothetical protein